MQEQEILTGVCPSLAPSDGIVSDLLKMIIQQDVVIRCLHL